MTASPHTVAALALALLEGSEGGFASVAAFEMIERLAGLEDVSEGDVMHELIQLNGADSDHKRRVAAATECYRRIEQTIHKLQRKLLGIES